MDVMPILAEWRDKRMNGFDRNESCSAIEYAALCFWTGQMDFLKVLKESTNEKCVDDFAGACISAAKGDLAAAYAGTTFMTDFVSSKGAECEILITMPASHLFALAVATLHKPSKARIARLASKMQPARPDYIYALPENARTYCAAKSQESIGFLHLANGWSYSIVKESVNEWFSPVCRAGAAFSALIFGEDRKNIEDFAPEALRLASKAITNNLPSVAALYLSVFGWAFKGDAAKEAQLLVNKANKANGIWLRPFETDSGIWKLVVAAFDKCLPTAKKIASSNNGGMTKSGRIVWSLNFRDQEHKYFDDDAFGYDNPDGEAILTCDAIKPCYRGPRGADDGSDDKSITFKSLLSGKYEKILTETDRAVITALQKSENLKKFDQEIPASVIEVLCGYDCVTKIKKYDVNSAKRQFTAIEIVKKDIPLSVKSTAERAFLSRCNFGARE